MAVPRATLATVIEQAAHGSYRLSDGRTLLSTRPVGQQEVFIGSWVRVDGWPYEITNMLARLGGGRILHLNDSGNTLVLAMTSFETVEKFTVLEASRRG